MSSVLSCSVLTAKEMGDTYTTIVTERQNGKSKQRLRNVWFKKTATLGIYKHRLLFFLHENKVVLLHWAWKMKE